MLTQTHKQFFLQVTSLISEIVHTVFSLLPTTAFLLVSILPTEALAYSLHIDPSSSLLFETKHLIFDEPLPPASYPFKEGSVLGVTATAYSSTVDQTDGDPFTTASGTRVSKGTLAANFLPFGTKVRIGPQIYTVEDRLNSRYNGTYRIDIWMNSTDQARTFGIRPQIIEIVSIP